MKKQFYIAALSTALILTGCSKETTPNTNTDNNVSGLAKEIVTEKSGDTKKVDVTNLSRESHGYGQGVSVDDQNRTTDSLSFNEQYKELKAKAINNDSKKITLTFDQGYENGYTAKILDVLKEKKVKATFFLLQDYAEKNPELVKRMIDEGHILGNHSVHHYSMPTLDQAACEKEIMDFHKYMLDKYNYNMTLFRPPMGEYSEFSLGVTANCGYETVLWSYAYNDWDVNNQPDKQQSLDKLTTAAHPGAIYLLHSVSETNAAILGDFIDGVRKAGFEFE